jgi:hypothetical protein
MNNDHVPAVVQTAQRANAPIRLSTVDDYLRFAKMVAESGLAPKGTDANTIAVTMVFGAEIGLGPLASLQNIAVINGRPAVWGDAALALCKTHPDWDESVFSEEIFYDPASGKLIGARCTVRRRPGKPVTREFTVEDAVRANLWGKPGPWQQYPQRMLQMRARSWALRDAFPDVLRGFSITEEALDIPEPVLDVEPQEVTQPDEGRVQKLTAKIRSKPARQISTSSPQERAQSENDMLF